ncbi:GTP-binding protein, partial [bacterium]|nr:GTP-binding protein [bacterium]
MSNDMLWNSDENRQKMKVVMIETAGHVDHGKTSLVQAVSKNNTDTLPEEKKRGMTIETGFTSFKLNEEITAVIADVPGHENFINNMLMGSCFADIVYLLIDSKEGIMPQTVEHLKLISHLSPNATIIAIISKIDLIDHERLEELRDEIYTFLVKEKIKNFYIQYFSAISKIGLKEILDLTEKIAISIDRKKDLRPFRMSIARVFSLKGIGTVITGYPISGEVNLNSKIELLPSKKNCTIKNIQIAGNNVKNASIGST